MKDLFERPSGFEAAILVSVDFGDHDYEESLNELRQLSMTAGLAIRGTIESKRNVPDAKYFIGSGKADELKLMMQASEANIAVFNHDLSPSQQRNLERLLEARVVDRTGLILDIFSQRAQSHEGQLQVELAQLEHLSTRLVRGWTHLERQKGGIGVRGGPGETQLELDRRMLRVRVKQLREKLIKLKAQRGMQRRARKRSSVMTVSLVGYTNAGKSTLFNRLTKADIYVADQLFATLDTTTHKIFIPDCGSVVISDTVGFIKHLPHALVEAFGATLEEAAQADLLLHVVDTASSNRDEQIAQVNKVLLEIGAANVPQILIHNQIDRVGLLPEITRDEYGRINTIHVSAKTGEGMDLLRLAMAEHYQFLQRKNTEESAYV
ncbi:MAG: GTPase HflX [Methylotenera sp.]|nr:MAG: GTPase HflX [Methylotenera sp.]